MASNLNVKPAGTERLGNMLEEETSYTLQRHNTENSKQIFPGPRKGTARLQSQFLYSCFYKRFIYSPHQSAYYAAGK